MVNLKILESFGSTNARLREVLTATGDKEPPRKGETSAEKRERLKRNNRAEQDVIHKNKFVSMVQSRILGGIEYSLKNHRPYAAVDLAWDSIVLNKINMPLLLYAQGKIDVQRAASLLENLPQGSDYIVKKDDKATSINLPKFIESEVNMIRSMINRRWAAQKNKYANLWPYYNYESRSTGLAGKLRADVMSQRADIMVDQFGVRHHDSQVMLDGLLYGHSVDFVRSSWEVEEQIRYKDLNAEATESYICKEGIGWINPHPSRLFWDLSYPLSSLNTDSGCEYVGFWDVVRYGAVENNPDYFNRDKIGFGANMWGGSGFYSQYRDYFNQYNYAIKIPVSTEKSTNGGQSIDMSGLNDSKANIGIYSTTNRDSSMFFANYFHRLVPRAWGFGDYAHPVWLRVVFASDSVPVYAEFLPSRPGAVLSINENDSRAVSVSMAMDVMQWQQQMTNLLNHLMGLLQIESFKAIGINTDALTQSEVKKIEGLLAGEDWYSNPLVFRYSLTKKLEQMGISATKALTDVITISESRVGQTINTVFESMVKLLSLAERMQAMSAAESGQSEPREISATQTNVIANTTQTIYSSISDCIDEWREAKKVIIYESTVSCQRGVVECPVKDRYTKNTIKAAGFLPKPGETEDYSGPAKRVTVIGTPRALVHNYIFSSRDGSERAVNTQAANTLVQLLAQILAVPTMVQAMGKEKLYSIFNEIFRMSGSGYDLNLQLAEGEDDSIGQDKIAELSDAVDQVAEMMQQLAKQTQMTAQGLAEQQNVNAEQQESINLSAKMAEQVLKLQAQVQEILQSRDRKIEIPEVPYEKAPWSVQAQIETMNGLTPASDAERKRVLESTKPKPTAKSDAKTP